jgi:hypothetical protein
MRRWRSTWPGPPRPPAKVTFAKGTNSWRGKRRWGPLVATALWIVLLVVIVIAAAWLTDGELSAAGPDTPGFTNGSVILAKITRRASRPLGLLVITSKRVSSRKECCVREVLSREKYQCNA